MFRRFNLSFWRNLWTWTRPRNNQFGVFCQFVNQSWRSSHALASAGAGLCASSLLLPNTHCFVLESQFFDSDDITSQYNAELFSAARDNDLRTLKKLLAAGADANSRHILGWMPIHVAAFHGHTEIVYELLSKQADIDATDEFSSVGLMAQTKEIHPFHVMLLRQEEFSPSLRPNVSYQGCTALHYAVLANNLAVVQMLLDSGADPLIRNAVGHVAADYAKDKFTKQILAEHAEKFQKIKQMKELEERRKYPLEDRIKKTIIGQDAAINTVASAIRRKENGWIDDDHPLVFLFLGSSGIGKTETAKEIARYLHKDIKKGFIRIDMSEYQQKHEVAKFIGSPPGYVGHEEGGQLTKKLEEFPEAVVLFDEVEKAHPDILTIMLQLFDEGRLTDGQGKTIACKNAIFIMTSNLASERIADHAIALREEASRVRQHKLNGTIDEKSITEEVTISRNFKENVIQPILKRAFRRDEFLGRINEMVYFLPFSRSELIQLVLKELEFWKDKVEQRVVNKLANAHERGLITENAKLRLVSNVKSLDEDRKNAVIELEIMEKGAESFKPVQLGKNVWDGVKGAVNYLTGDSGR